MEMLMLEEQNKRLLELLRNQSRITPDNNSSGGGRAPSAGTMQPTSRGALTLVPGKKRPTSEDSSWDETKGAWKIAELQTELNRLRGRQYCNSNCPSYWTSAYRSVYSHSRHLGPPRDSREWTEDLCTRSQLLARIQCHLTRRLPCKAKPPVRVRLPAHFGAVRPIPDRNYSNHAVKRRSQSWRGSRTQLARWVW